MDEILVGGATRYVVGRDVLDASTLLGDATPRTVAVVAPPGAAEVADRVAAAVRGHVGAVGVVEVPDGDAAKTLAVVERVAHALNDLGMVREDLIIGVGGGSTTDLAGFVAATYLRGVRAHYVSTTVLGAVDASIGGKTGVNVGGKNLIGSFRHPARVVVDIGVLEGLPAEVRRQGMAEALKAGFVGDPGLVELIERDGLRADLEAVVRMAVAVKAAVVGRDFTESGERIVLNYGHTIGHAIEIAGGMAHGDAVAVGMVAAARVSAVIAGFAAEARHTEAITGLGLPITAPAVDPRRVDELIALDKKRDRNGTRMVVLEEIGRPMVAHVDAATVRAALDAVGIRRLE